MRYKYIREFIQPTGADGSAAASGTLLAAGNTGKIVALSVDYSNQPASTDIVVSDGGGHTVFSRANSATDVAWSPVARPGADEGGAATNSTDMPGLPFVSGLTYTVAQADSSTAADHFILVEALVLIDGPAANRKNPAKYRKYKLQLFPEGDDGSAAVSEAIARGASGVIEAIAIDYVSQPATTDITIVDGAGHTVFSRADSLTDVAWSPAGRTGADEGGAASSAVDMPGLPFHGGLTVSVAQGDAGAAKYVYVELLCSVS